MYVVSAFPEPPDICEVMLTRFPLIHGFSDFVNISEIRLQI